MATADLRPIGDYLPNVESSVKPTIEQATILAQQLLGANAVVDREPRMVIYAGTEKQTEEPRLAMEFEARIGTNLDGADHKRRPLSSMPREERSFTMRIESSTA